MDTPPFRIKYYANAAGSFKTSIWVFKTTWNADGTLNPSQSFAQDGKRYNPSNGYYEPTMQSLRECYTDNINISNLQKIADLPTQTTAVPDYLTVYWDGTTDPALTGGKKYPVRDCVYYMVQDADDSNNNNYLLLSSVEGGVAFGMFQSTAGVTYTTDGKNNYSAKIDVPILQPVTHVYALLMSNECNISTLTFSAVNKGAPYMVQYMNAKAPGNQQVLAYTELTNPVIDKTNPIIYSYTWKDMKWIKMDGTQTSDPIYPTTDFPYFIMTVVLETNNKTVTGINDGYINDGPYIDMRKAQVITGIPAVTPQSDEIQITPADGTIRVQCPGNMCLTRYDYYGAGGQLLKAGAVSGQDASVALPPAPKGTIGIFRAFVKDLENNGMERFNTTKTISR